MFTIEMFIVYGLIAWAIGVPVILLGDAIQEWIIKIRRKRRV